MSLQITSMAGSWKSRQVLAKDARVLSPSFQGRSGHRTAWQISLSTSRGSGF